MDKYQLDARTAADDRGAEAKVRAGAVRNQVQRRANDVLVVVMFAIAPFFASMSTKVRHPGMRTRLHIVGCVGLIGTAVGIATLAVSVSV